jgi:hypothetical protein
MVCPVWLVGLERHARRLDFATFCLNLGQIGGWRRHPGPVPPIYLVICVGFTNAFLPSRWPPPGPAEAMPDESADAGRRGLIGAG